MLIIQSRGQGIFDRFYTLFTQFIWYIALVLFIAIFTEYYPKDLLNNFTVPFFLVMAFSIWLWVFNSGESKLIEHGLELNDEGITYISYDDKVTIEWSNFVGVRVINNFPRYILLNSSSGDNIQFSYFMFSSAQRTKLFDYLEKK